MSLPGTMIYSSAKAGAYIYLMGREGQWRGAESPSPAFSPEEGSREHYPTPAVGSHVPATHEVSVPS